MPYRAPAFAAALPNAEACHLNPRLRAFLPI
jgi:hypothetical protein